MGDDLRILSGLLVLAALAWAVSPAVRLWKHAHSPTSLKVESASVGGSLVWSPAASSFSREDGTYGLSSSPLEPGWVGLLLGQRLDLNGATTEDLVVLPGVGPATALEIVRTREELGLFRHTEELLSVRGIGTKTLDRLRPWVSTARRP